MKISSETVSILQNYASINNGIKVSPGSKIKTVSPNKTILASADVTETFEQEFCIYDLSQFLGTLSLFDSPELTFNKNDVTISGNSTKVRYVFADPNTIVTVPEKELAIEPDISLALSKENIARIFKAANILSLPNLVIAKDEGNLIVKATDVKNKSSNEVAITLEDDAKIQVPDANFNMVFKIENLKLYQPSSYNIGIAKSGIARFSGAVDYFIAVERADSNFN